jgi:methionyl-tRNA formyltransferase
MRIAFAGTPEFAAVALQALLDAGHEIALVFTQPGRPAGRGMQLRMGAVGELAVARGLPLLTPPSLRTGRGQPSDEAAGQALQRLREADCDLLVVAAYGLILPQAMLDIPRGIGAGAQRVRALNIHASLLPRWRGAAPVARAIEAGDERTGVTLMQMDAGLDTGPMLECEALDIGPGESAGALTTRLAGLGARMLVGALERTALWATRPQPGAGVTYAAKIERREAWIDWRLPAERIERAVRAFDPEPGACSRLDGEVVKIWSARAAALASQAAPAGVAEAAGAAGMVIASGPDALEVACGQGVLRVLELQRAGGKRLPARAFLAGRRVAPGARWASDPPPVAQRQADRG